MHRDDHARDMTLWMIYGNFMDAVATSLAAAFGSAGLAGLITVVLRGTAVEIAFWSTLAGLAAFVAVFWREAKEVGSVIEAYDRDR